MISNHSESIRIPMTLIDELVVMRYAQLTEDQIKKIEKRALKKHHGNFGVDAIAKKHNQPTVAEMVASYEKV